MLKFLVVLDCFNTHEISFVFFEVMKLPQSGHGCTFIADISALEMTHLSNVLIKTFDNCVISKADVEAKIEKFL